MKLINRFLFLLVAISLIQTSCSKVSGRIKISYTKATAVYGNLDSLRSLPLVNESKSVERAVGHFVGRDYILIGERSKGVHVFDNTNMSAPENISFINIPFCKEFYVDGDYLYAESGYDLLKINIKDVRSPKIEHRMNNAFSHKVYKNNKGEVLLGFTYQKATDEFTVGSPEAKEIERQGKLHVDHSGRMIPLSTVPTMFVGNNGKSKGTINRIAVYYDHIYVIGIDKLHVFQTSAAQISKTSTITIDEGSETLYTERNRLFIGSESMVRVYNLKNRSNPTMESKVEHATSCDPVLAEGDVAYSTLRSTANEGCAGTDNVLLVLEVKPSKKARLLETIDMRSPYGMTIFDNLLLVGEGLNGLTIFNITEKERPEELKKLNNIVAYDVMLHPTIDNVIIVTDNLGLKEYAINWDDL
jgi:hypothetical protein